MLADVAVCQFLYYWAFFNSTYKTDLASNMDGGENFLLGGFSRAGGNQTDGSEYVVTKRKKPSISLLYERNREFGYPMEGTKYVSTRWFSSSALSPDGRSRVL